MLHKNVFGLLFIWTEIHLYSLLFLQENSVIELLKNSYFIDLSLCNNWVENLIDVIGKYAIIPSWDPLRDWGLKIKGKRMINVCSQCVPTKIESLLYSYIHVLNVCQYCTFIILIQPDFFLDKYTTALTLYSYSILYW